MKIFLLLKMKLIILQLYYVIDTLLSHLLHLFIYLTYLSII